MDPYISTTIWILDESLEKHGGWDHAGRYARVKDGVPCRCPRIDSFDSRATGPRMSDRNEPAYQRPVTRSIPPNASTERKVAGNRSVQSLRRTSRPERSGHIENRGSFGPNVYQSDLMESSLGDRGRPRYGSLGILDMELVARLHSDENRSACKTRKQDMYIQGDDICCARMVNSSAVCLDALRIWMNPKVQYSMEYSTVQ